MAFASTWWREQNLRTQRTRLDEHRHPAGAYDRRQHVSVPSFMNFMIGYLADGLTERGFQLTPSRDFLDHEVDGWLERIGVRFGNELMVRTASGESNESERSSGRPAIDLLARRVGRAPARAAAISSGRYF